MSEKNSMYRQVAIDTETTGLDPKDGHRIIELACVEIIERRITGSHYHCYINPKRSIDAGAIAVHGLNEDFLADKPTFDQVVNDLMTYIAGAELIIHNAPFDVGFLQKELQWCRRQEQLQQQWKITDTLVMARQLYPRQKNNLDALCKRLSVDNSQRHYHGALIDAQLLAQVYLAMTSGQNTLFGAEIVSSEQAVANHNQVEINKEQANLIVQAASDIEKEQHVAYLQQMKKKGKSIWLDKYVEGSHD
jgi:DNA polymerase-3 subunit epsilon